MLDAYRAGGARSAVSAERAVRQHHDAKAGRRAAAADRGARHGRLQEHWDYIYEPEAAYILDGLLMRYIESQVYRAAVENVASEMAARMVAMKAASDNAGKLITELQLIYKQGPPGCDHEGAFGDRGRRRCGLRKRTMATPGEGQITQITARHRRRVSRESIPRIYEGAQAQGRGLTLEVQQQLGDGVVRTIAMGSSEGLKRGLVVQATGAPISVPVGKGTLGRNHGRAGCAQDNRGPVQATEYLPITGRRPRSSSRPAARTCWSRASKVIDLLVPFAKGGKVGLFGGAGVGKTRQHARAHQQHRQAVQRPVGVRRRRRSAPARGTTSITR